ncbi:ABC transporter permease [Bradyrhizobium guangdongense]|uniref:ABC transporter permease n=1 Tax=Bradyrhizobium guangdongense TaxID=1325090 RepID=UPI00112A53F9|nr:iron ABC transporter permease [Bradyrhizobium guangdongense]TPQ29185.1 ABC transporter permease [Bradyrhizobium guangdongense]
MSTLSSNEVATGSMRLGFRAGRLMEGKAPRRLALAALALLLAFLSLYPLSMLLYGSLHTTPPGIAGTFDLSGYRQVFTWPTALLFANTVGISLLKTIFSLLLAVLFGWIISRTDTPMRGALEVLITLPFFVPPILTAMAWGMLGNPQVGVINLVWQRMFGSETPLINVYSYSGVVWHMVQYSTPFLFLFVVEAFRAMDPALEEASRMCGGSQWSTFRRVSLPLMMPAVITAFLLSFIRGLENFESPLFFGTPARIEVVTTAIYNSIHHQSIPNYQFASALSFVIMALMFLLVFWQWRMLRGRSFQTVTGKGYSPRVIKLGSWRWLTFALCMVFFLVSVVLPIGQLLLGSFFQFFGFYQWDMLTLDHYRSVLGNDEVWRAFRNTFLLGFGGASVTMLLGSIVAYVSTRTRWSGRRLIDVLAWLPWMMPGMVLAVGFLWGFAFLPGAITIYGTIWALLIAYVALGTPISVRVMSAAYHQLSFDLEECSRVHGAGWWQTLWRILVALAWPSFAVGWVLTFFGIMRELSASVLLYSVGSEVLSVVLLRMWENGQAEAVSVVGLMMMSLVFLFRWVQLRLIKRYVNAL